MLVESLGWSFISITTVLGDYTSVWAVVKVFLLWVLIAALVYYAGEKIYGAGSTEIARSPETASPAIPTITCPKCQTMIRTTDASFKGNCWRCGANLTSIPITCPHCGRKNPPLNRTCLDCGKVIQDRSQF